MRKTGCFGAMRATSASEASAPMPPKNCFTSHAHSQDRRLLVVGHLINAHILGLPADGESSGAADADIAHPLRLAARGDQVALALEAERVDRGAVPLATLAPLHREHAGPLHAQPKPT